MRAAVIGAIALSGCTGSTTISVESAFDPPTFLAYREGTGSWKTPQPVSGGTYAANHYSFDVNSDYELVAVSIDPYSGKAISTELRAGNGDGSHWYLGGTGAYETDGVVFEPSHSSVPGLCSSPKMPFQFPGSVIASGTMTQPGEIWIGGWCTASDQPSWSYQLSVVPGVHDIFATDPVGSPSPRVAMIGGVSIDSATTLPTIDLAATGQPLDSVTVTVVNTGADPNDAVPITSKLDLFTATEGATLAAGTDLQVASRSHVVPIVPASLLESTDSQVLTIWVTDNSNALRVANTRHPRETPVFEFLSPPTISYTTDTGSDTAGWADPLSTRVGAIDVNTWTPGALNNLPSETVTATTRWLDAHRATSLGFDLDIPAFDPSWAVDITQMHNTQFTVRAIEGNISYATTQTQ